MTPYPPFTQKLFKEGEDAGNNDPFNAQRKRKALAKPSTLTESKPYEESDVTSKITDLASRISSIVTDISKLTSQFRSAFNNLQKQSKLQADKQSQQDQTLVEILNILKSHITLQTPIVVPTDASEEANNPQMSEAGSPTRAAGHC
jgi:Sec-independent protein translocase protein TatA